METTGGILLGLSTGAVCLVYCGPVLIPFLLGERSKIKKNSLFVLLFLFGRLFSYLLTGLLVGIIGTSFLLNTVLKIKVMGFIYVLLAILLIIYGFYRFKEICLGHAQKKMNNLFRKRFPLLIPIAGGVFTGLNLCPPFLLAIAKAAGTGNLMGSIWFFFMFFIGTSVFFIPLPFVGFFHRQKAFQIIGKFAAILSGCIYLYQGILMTIK